MKRLSPTNGYFALRWMVLERDRFTCQYCGQSAPNVKLEADHVIPVSQGGEDKIENLKTSCYACNRGRNASTLIIRTKRQAHPFIVPCKRQDQIIELLNSHPEGINEQAIAKALNIRRDNAHMATHRLRAKSKICKKGDLWFGIKE